MLIVNKLGPDWDSNSQRQCTGDGTDCIGSYKSKYHTITTTAAPFQQYFSYIVNVSFVGGGKQIITGYCLYICITMITIVSVQGHFQ